MIWLLNFLPEYASGLWLDADPITYTKKTCALYLEKIGLHAQNLLSILGSITNIVEDT